MTPLPPGVEGEIFFIGCGSSNKNNIMLSVFAPHLLVVPCQNKSSIKGGEVQKYVAYLDVWWASGWGGEVVHAMMHRRFYPLKSSHLDNLMRGPVEKKLGKQKAGAQNLDRRRAPVAYCCQKCGPVFGPKTVNERQILVLYPT